MIITSLNGRKYKLTKTRLCETDVSPTMATKIFFGLRLKDLKNSDNRWVGIRCIGSNGGFAAQYVNPRKRWADVKFSKTFRVIGCARFNAATALKIKAAVEAA